MFLILCNDMLIIYYMVVVNVALPFHFVHVFTY